MNTNPRSCQLLAGGEPLGQLPRAMRSERLGDDRREGDGAAVAGGFQLGQAECPTDALERLFDGERLVLKIDIVPLETEDFPAAEAEGDRDLIGGG